MKYKAEFERKGKVIKNLETGHVEKFDSIALAKQKSRAIQGSELGLGKVRVAK